MKVGVGGTILLSSLSGRAVHDKIVEGSRRLFHAVECWYGVNSVELHVDHRISGLGWFCIQQGIRQGPMTGLGVGVLL